MAACQEAAKPFTYFSLQIAGLISCLGVGGIRDNLQITTSEGKGGKRAPLRAAPPPRRPRAKLA